MKGKDDSNSTIEDARSKTNSAPTTDRTDGGWAFEAQDQYNPTESSDLTTVIIGAIAKAEGVSITEVRSPPLYEVVDIAAIEQALFGRHDVSANGTESSVEFRYNEYKVSVEADGWVTVSKRADESTAE